ncbi:MAG: GltB/FmdC/FwdC-like GXGXG domain-containing protein [Anaerolineae bacterium]
MNNMPAAPITQEKIATIDAKGMYYRELNEKLLALVTAGAETIEITNVIGQRYLGTNLHHAVRLIIHGVPGNDLGAFMDGPQIEVMGSAQDGCGNTMNSGSIIIHGSAGDILGHSMRGGKIMVKGNVGYRVGIHMKEYEAVRPMIVIGGTAQHFLGEYMSGGVMVVLGLQLDAHDMHPTHHLGTGMHGGVIYMRGQVDSSYLGKEVGLVPIETQDEVLLHELVQEYADHYGVDVEGVFSVPFVKLVPRTKRPYGQLYAY